MKLIRVVSLFFVFLILPFFTRVDTISAQTCTGTSSCCIEGIYTYTPIGCKAGNPGCVMTFTCTNTDRRNCQTMSGQCTAQHQSCLDNINANCRYTGGGGGSTPTPAPTGGGGGGGGGATYCTVEWQALPSLRVGQSGTVQAFARGGSENWSGRFSWSGTNLGTFNPTTDSRGAQYTTTFTPTQSGTSTITIRVEAGSEYFCQGSASITVTAATATPVPAAPTADIRANNSNSTINIANNTAATLSWTSRNATSCEGRQAWTGAKALNGSQSTGRLAEGTYNYAFFCRGPGGTVLDAIRVNVGPAATTPPPVGCTCGAWANGACGGGTCGATQRLQTRACTPNLCSTETRCIADAACVSTPPPTAPTVDIRANNSNGPITITSGTAASLSWTSTNAASCTASGGWSGAKAINGSQSSGNLSASRTFTITCTGAGGSRSDSVTVNVQGAPTIPPTVAPTAPPTPPTVDIRANSSNGPITITSGTAATLSWTSARATSCTASGGWSGNKATSGSQSSGNLTGSRVFSITCTGAGGTATDSVTVNVAGAPTPPAGPTVDIRANSSNGPITITSGTSAVLSWTSARATSCSASGGWSGAKAISGSQATGALSAGRTYSITCVGAGGSASDSVTVNVTGGPTVPPGTPVPTVAPTPTPPPASCTISANPASISSAVGTSRNIATSVTQANGTISQVRFISSNTAVATATSPDSASPFSSQVSIVGSGNASIRVSAIMGGVERCSDTVPITAPPPSCTLSLGSNRTVTMGTTANVTASTTQANGSVSQVQFQSSNPSIVSVSPVVDSSSPFTTQVTPVRDGTVTLTARGIMAGSQRCQDSITITVPAPTCTLNLSPDPAQGIIAQQSTMAANTTQQNGVVSEVRFVSANTGIATVTSPDTSAPWTTTVTGVSEGRTTVTAEGIMYGVSRCQDTATLDIIPPEPWYQLVGGDGISGGNLDSPIPPSCVLPGCNPNFILNRSRTDPGVAMYNGSVADFSSSTSSRGTVSSKQWLAQSRNFLSYSYDLFASLIPGNAPRQSIAGAVGAGYLDQARPTDPKGYTWYVAGGSVTLNGNTTISGNRKVILFVPGNVTINGRINLAGANNFFLIIARGNIIVNPDVTNGNNPALEGIFYSQGTFRSGTRGEGNTDSRLVIRGSVVANDVLFERDLRVGNVNTPAEVVDYSNNLMFNYPIALAPKRLVWRETLP